MIVIAAIISAVLFFLYFKDYNDPNKDVPSYSEYVDIGTDISEDIKDPDEPYVSPVDFEALHKINPDIYAWLMIPGTDISYPIVQNDDDTYYLRRNTDKKWALSGSIFSESTYNGKDFEDAITVLYGHRMDSGEMFGSVQRTYSSLEKLKEHNVIKIYLQDREISYRVFAAVPYDRRHIMYNYGDGTPRNSRLFLYSIANVKEIDAVIDNDEFAEIDDKMLVLSTCLYGDRTRRYIVAAKKIEIYK